MKKISHFLIAVALFVPSAVFAQTPPTPTNTLPVVVSGVDVYDTGATIKGRVDSIVVTPMAVTYGTDRSILPGQVFLIAGPDGFFTVRMRSLLPNTKYYYQIASIDPVLGRKSITNISSFTTKSPLVSLQIQKMNPVSATISGKVLSASGQGLGIWVGPSDSVKGMVFIPKLQADKTFSEKVEGLTPETSYDMFMQSQNGVQLSGITTFKTPGLSVYIRQLADKWVTLGVDAFSGIQGLTVNYGEKNNPNTPDDQVVLNQTVQMKLEDGVYSAKIEGLNPSTYYVYTVEMKDNASSTSKTGVYSFTTPKLGTEPVAPDKIVDTSNSTTATRSFSGKLVPCSGVEISADGKTTTQTCTFNDVIKLFANIIDFLLFIIAPIIATALLLYGGVLILFSGGSTEKVSKAKGIFSKAIVGLVLAMGAWLIVKFIMQKLGYNGDIFPTFY